ncbi:MAG: hypothetical protein ACOYKE_12455 [Ferruginibacter sp.]
MKKAILLPLVFSWVLVCFCSKVQAQENTIDTVYTGVYINSIHSIDFKDKEYTIDFWLWLNYKNKDFDFVNNLEIPQAKSVNKSFVSVDTSKPDNVYMLLKMQCVMRDSWKIGNFPFDRQKLRLTVENSQFDKSSLVFAADTLGEHYDPKFILRGWQIDSFDVSIGNKVYQTAFGDRSVLKPRSEYSTYKVRIGIKRDAMGLFWKMFLGMYIAFFIAYVCFYIHEDGIESRFGLSVGALFAVIGNKYIIDSALPESTSFTLVDTLHGLTLFFILAVVTSTAYSLILIKKNKKKQANKFDFVMAQVLLILYIALNAYFIANASSVG